MNFRHLAVSLIYLCFSATVWAGQLFIPMDASGQKDHLRAYGIAYAAMKEGIPVAWLLNYKGGSFVMADEGDIKEMCRQKGVTCKEITDNEYARIVKQIKAPGFNGDVIRLDKPPKIAVYTPLNKEPWDDAVTLALTYAGIPFDKLFADEVLAGELTKYDWLHLHHEDFTGEYSKFWAHFQNDAWYRNDKHTMEELAASHGLNKVSQLQLAVVKKIRDFVGAGGNLFAMCTASSTFDIALAAEGIDICDTRFDGDPADPFANDKLNYKKCFAFKGFSVVIDPYNPVHSDIDYASLNVPEEYDYFTLVSTAAKNDPVAAMLCQDHVTTIKGFMGQTTAFREGLLKPGVIVLGKNVAAKDGSYPYSSYNSNRAKYIHGTYGKGAWTFYGGHDPESYRHIVGSAPTDLSLFPNSPGYRLILNNLLLPAAKKALGQTKKSPPITENKNTISSNEQTVPVKIKLYPDHENNELVIVFDTITGNKGSNGNAIGNVTITDHTGAEVFNHSYNVQKVSIDIKDFPGGIYQVSVNGKYIGRMVKE